MGYLHITGSTSPSICSVLSRGLVCHTLTYSETVAKQAMHGSWLLKVFVLGLMICGRGPGGIAAVSRSCTGDGSSQYPHAGHHRGLTRRTRRLPLTTKAVITA